MISLGSSRSAARRRFRFEAELHPLPVALVEVVELVEVPEEPVLQDEPGVVRFAGDVGVDDRRRLAFLDQLLEGPGVDAGVAERLAFEVEVVAVGEAGDVGGGRRLLDVFQPAGLEVVVGEGHGGVAEHGVDAGRLVLLGAGFAGRVLLFAQHRDRRVAGGQLPRSRVFRHEHACRLALTAAEATVAGRQSSAIVASPRNKRRGQAIKARPRYQGPVFR